VVSDADSGFDITARRWSFEKGDADGDVGYAVTWAGMSVCLVHELKPAAEIVREIHDEVILALQSAHSLVE